jgi:hypothetical protein
MRPIDDPTLLTPDQRLREVANIMATGVLRLHARAALSGDDSKLAGQEGDSPRREEGDSPIFARKIGTVPMCENRDSPRILMNRGLMLWVTAHGRLRPTMATIEKLVTLAPGRSNRVWGQFRIFRVQIMEAV